MKNAYNWFVEHRERLFTFSFAVIALIVSIIIATGFVFDFNELTKASFYLKTATNFFIMITLFNAVKSDVVREERLSPKSDFYNSKQRTDKFVKRIHDEHLEDVIDQAVLDENKRRFDKAIERELNRYVHGMSIDPETKEVVYGKKLDGTPMTRDEFFEIKGIKKKKHKKKIIKSINRALAGNVYYIQISSYEVLNGFANSGKRGCDDAEMSFNEAKENMKENRNKILSFLAIAVAFAITTYDDSVADWWVKIFSQTFLIITSCLSACLVGKKHIDKMTQIEINRSTFLNNIFKDDDKEKAEEKVEMAQPLNNNTVETS